jgi:hypothetical protein
VLIDRRLKRSPVRQKARQKIAGGRKACHNRAVERLTFGVRPTLKPAENPGGKRAREDSNL